MIFRYYAEIHFYTHFWNHNTQKIPRHEKNFIVVARLMSPFKQLRQYLTPTAWELISIRRKKWTSGLKNQISTIQFQFKYKIDRKIVVNFSGLAVKKENAFKGDLTTFQRGRDFSGFIELKLEMMTNSLINYIRQHERINPNGAITTPRGVKYKSS